MLGRWTSPSAGFLEDVVVEWSERVAELCPKFVRGHGVVGKERVGSLVHVYELELAKKGSRRGGIPGRSQHGL